MNPEVQKTAQDMQRMFYRSGHREMHGLEQFQKNLMTSQDMQMFEQLGGTNDDAARFFGTPRPLVMLDTNSHLQRLQNATMEFHTRTILPQKNGNEKEIARKLIGFQGLRHAPHPHLRRPADGDGPRTPCEGGPHEDAGRHRHRTRFAATSTCQPWRNGDVPMAVANLMTLKGTHRQERRSPAAEARQLHRG